MKSKLLSLLISLCIFISCEKDNEEFLVIEGITEIDSGGCSSHIDPDDWNLDDIFTDREKQLFDTLDFSRTAIAKPLPPIEEIPGYLTPDRSPHIFFAPNPFHISAALGYYRNDHILNLVIVDNKYNKLFSWRTEEFNGGATFYFENLKKGIYRMYYVLQDKNYNIVYCGHGDIKNE